MIIIITTTIIATIILLGVGSQWTWDNIFFPCLLLGLFGYGLLGMIVPMKTTTEMWDYEYGCSQTYCSLRDKEGTDFIISDYEVMQLLTQDSIVELEINRVLNSYGCTAGDLPYLTFNKRKIK